VVSARGSTELAEVRDRMSRRMVLRKPLSLLLFPLKIQRGEGTKAFVLAKNV
jgi:hypothetical protein